MGGMRKRRGAVGAALRRGRTHGAGEGRGAEQRRGDGHAPFWMDRGAMEVRSPFGSRLPRRTPSAGSTPREPPSRVACGASARRPCRAAWSAPTQTWARSHSCVVAPAWHVRASSGACGPLASMERRGGAAGRVAGQGIARVGHTSGCMDARGGRRTGWWSGGHLSNGVFLRGKAIESGEAVGFVRVGRASVARLSRRHPTRLSRAEGGGEAARGPGPEVAEALAQAYLGEEVEGQQAAREEQHRLVHLQLQVVDPVQRSQQRCAGGGRGDM